MQSTSPANGDLFVSTTGRDSWTGLLPEPNADSTDGPLATLGGAVARLRKLVAAVELSGPVTVWLRDGVYRQSRPTVFTPADSYPVTFRSYPNERAIIDGSRTVTGWREAVLNDRKVLAVDLPDVRERGLNFYTAFVNDKPAPRAHFPKTTAGGVPQWHTIKDAPGTNIATSGLTDGNDTVVLDPATFIARANLHDVEVVVMHYWVEERMPVETYDPATGRLKSSAASRYTMRSDFSDQWSRYYVDNVREALTEPGEWYLDRPQATLYYLPREGETAENLQLSIPLTPRLIEFRGEPKEKRYVQFIRIVDLTFRNTDAPRTHDVTPETHPLGGGLPAGSGPQSATIYNGAIDLTGARHCAIEQCELTNLGWYAIDLKDGCRGNRIVANHIHNIGAGGIKMSGSDADGAKSCRSGQNLISDNHIHAIGRIFHSGCGIIVRHGDGNRIIHNHIHDAYYTGISVGWVWGYRENASFDNLIAYNHIHDLGQGWLSDMGGIYTLGVQPGTVIRGNLIHDVHAHGYGGWGIYPDEGTSHVIIEDNVVSDCKTNCFNQHYGRENIVRNNVFANGGTAQCTLGRAETWLAFTFERNLVITADQPIWMGDYGATLKSGDFFIDNNLYFSTTGVIFFSPRKSGLQKDGLTMGDWNARGFDRNSIIADPGEVDLKKGVYTVTTGSPADKVGMKSIDISKAGPR